MAAWSTLPIFYPSAGQVLSASDLNQIREAARLVDAWTYRNEPALDSTAGLDTGAPLYFPTSTPLRIWWGAVLFKTGCTTLTIEGRGALTGSEVLRVYVGGTDVTMSGTLAGTITIPGTFGAFSGSYAVSGNDGDVITVELVIVGTHLSTAQYLIEDVYLSPITKSGWVAAPSFASVADATDATKLNGLTFSLQWMYERLRLVPMPARQALYYNLGPFKPTTDAQHLNRPMYHGSVGKYYSNNYLRIKLYVVSTTTVGWKYDIYLNGVSVFTSSTFGIGSQAIDQTLSLASYTIGTRVRIAIFASTVTAGPAFPLRFTRWSNGVMHAVADGSGWPYATLPAAFTGPSATTNANTLRAALASLATIVNNAKTRIDARPELWARSRAVRRHFTKNGETEGLLIARARHGFWQRTGSELFVKGTDIKVAYGPVSVEVDVEGNGWEKYTFLKNEAVDAGLGTTVYLDDLEALDYGMSYRLTGNPIYAAEFVG